MVSEGWSYFAECAEEHIVYNVTMSNTANLEV